jgi:hypothetical protein
MKKALVFSLFVGMLSSGHLPALEANSGLDLRKTLSGQFAAPNVFTEAPRSGVLWAQGAVRLLIQRGNSAIIGHSPARGYSTPIVAASLCNQDLRSPQRAVVLWWSDPKLLNQSSISNYDRFSTQGDEHTPSNAVLK